MPANGRVAGVFDLGDGEQFVVAEWFPDPEVLEVEILNIASNFDDWSVPLHAAKEALIESTQAHFDSKSDPYGDKWQSLSDRYAQEKRNAGYDPEAILVREGNLEKAATSEDAWFVAENSIFFNVDALPRNPEDGVNYGAAHQSGTQEGIGASRLQAVLDKSARINEGSGESFSEEEAKTLLGGGRGLNLPQRMFVGADIDTIDEIEAIFIKHIEERIEIPWRGGGAPIIPTEGFNLLGGPFPIIKFTSRGQPILRTPRGPRFGRFLP